MVYKKCMYFLWVIVSLACFSLGHSMNSSMPLCHPDDRRILLQFRESFTTNINGPMNEFCPYPVEIIRSRSLTNEKDCCQWEWINCDTSTGDVVNIDLHCSGLNGSISSLSILFQLTHLESLVLSQNYITGEFPSSVNVANLSNLWELKLGANLLYGRVPSWVLNFPSIQELGLGANRFSCQLADFLANPSTSLQLFDLSENEFYGPVHALMMLSPNLTFLDVSSNSFSHTVKLNDIFSRFKNLRTLDLSDNSLHVVPTSKSDFKHSNSPWPKLSYLGLSSCKLGQLPFLGAIEELNGLNLVNNNLQGEIPEWFHSISESSPTDDTKWLNISHNSLTGGLEHLHWEWLNTIDISFNLFDGTLPPNVFHDELSTFMASNNRLSGEINATICNTTALYFLDLSNNTLTGEIPHCLLNSSPSLTILNLQSNKFSGSMLGNFANCEQLLYMDLSDNQLEGEVPRSLAHCTSLQVLNLANNKLKDMFPYWLSSLAQLKVLNLRWNEFYGPVVYSGINSPFPNLQILDISSNNFSGELPSRYIKSFTSMMSIHEKPGNPHYMGSINSEYFSVKLTFKGADMKFLKIITTMVLLDFSNNRFRGRIPDTLGQLVSLRGLNLSHNHLTETIPRTLGRLTLLDFLDLSSNRLSGTIPEELVRLTFLEVFNVSENQLVGRIPRGNNFDTFSADSYKGNPGLYGSPLLGHGTSEKATEEQEDDDDDDESLAEWKIVAIGYSFGTIVGMAWTYYMLSVGKPMARMVEAAIVGFVHQRFGGTHGRRAL